MLARVLTRRPQGREHDDSTTRCRDRNLTSRTYRERLAAEIVERIRTTYLPALRAAVAQLKAIEEDQG